MPTEVIDEIAKDILLITETSLSSYRVAERIEIITAECVFGMNVFRDMFAGITRRLWRGYGGVILAGA